MGHQYVSTNMTDSDNLSPDEWVKRMEQMKQDEAERAREKQSPLNKLGRPQRQDVDDDNITKRTRPRANYYDGMTKTSKWTRETFTVEYITRNGYKYTLECSCGNTRDDPKQFCPHRAREEWLAYYSKGEARQHDELPDEWCLTYDDYKMNDYNYSWDLAFPDD